VIPNRGWMVDEESDRGTKSFSNAKRAIREGETEEEAGTDDRGGSEDAGVSISTVIRYFDKGIVTGLRNPATSIGWLIGKVSRPSRPSSGSGQSLLVRPWMTLHGGGARGKA